MSSKVMISDLASGPNINLPLKINICKDEKTIWELNAGEVHKQTDSWQKRKSRIRKFLALLRHLNNWFFQIQLLFNIYSNNSPVFSHFMKKEFLHRVSEFYHRQYILIVGLVDAFLHKDWNAKEFMMVVHTYLTYMTAN